MNHTEQRNKLRALLAGSICLSPANIYDPLSARVAETVGFEIGLLSGSVVSNTTLAAPDLVTHTASEYAHQIRRIARVSRLCLYADGDHGYGNALNVMRTVQEFEHAGVSALSIEDTALPISFGQAEGEQRLISIEEGVGKMRAALAARADPSLIIVARTSALKVDGIAGAVARAQAYAAAGVDAIFLSGGAGKVAGVTERLGQIHRVHAATRLPIIVGTKHGLALAREELATCGARMVLQGHQPLEAALKALHETYTHLFNGGAAADLDLKIASAREMEQLVNGEIYRQRLRAYMR